MTADLKYPYYGATGIIDYIDEFIFDGKYVLVGEDGAPFFIKNNDVSFTASGKFWVNNHAHILECNEGLIPEILSHQLNLVDYRKHITGSTRDKLTQEDLKEISAVQIPYAEQTVIANYLDDKTTQIDTLITNKQKLIELLKEERTAVINQAVTRGINPKAKLKPSGIEWLGDIPAHWEVKRLKNVINGSLQNGIFKKSVDFGDGYKLINVSDVYNEGFTVNESNLGRVRLIDGELQKFKVNTDDIFFVRSSLKLEGIAVSAIVKVMTEPAVFECHLIKIEPNKKIIHPDFLIYFLNSNLILHTLVSLSKTTTMTTIGQDSISSLCLCLPSHSEQHAIVEHIKFHENRIHSIIERIGKEIGLLQEYRTALISEVVTGKIKVI